MDDGTGVIGCCVWLNAKEFDSRILDYKHGELLSLSGKISIFREQREISVDRIGRCGLSFSILTSLSSVLKFISRKNGIA